MNPIDAHTLETFRTDGVAVLRNVLPTAWLERLAAAIEDNMASPGPYGKNHADSGSPYFGDYVNWTRFPAFKDVASEGPLGQVAAQLMQSPSVRLFHEHVLVKEAGNPSATPWHQDMPYYCLGGTQTVSLWVPLDPVADAVCPRFLAGSHRRHTTYVPRRFKSLAPLVGDTSRYEPFPEIDEVRDAASLRHWALQPGDAIAFDYHTLHNAPANPTATRRRVVSLRYVGPDVHLVARPHEVSPPFPEMGLPIEMGAPLPEDWFPTVWPRP
ncbi:MAG: phytanoyl-CoA dioxygenase family protein [Burkholderiaceae bacterium]